MPKKYFIVGGWIAAFVWMVFRGFGPWLSGLNPWENISLSAILFRFLPLISAFSAYFLSRKYGKKGAGLAGFYASAILFSVWPGFIATLVVLYSHTRKPFLLTAIWTGLSAVVAAAPMVQYQLSDGGDLTYAAAYAALLLATALVACILLLVSVISLVIHLIKTKNPNNAQHHKSDRAGESEA